MKWNRHCIVGSMLTVKMVIDPTYTQNKRVLARRKQYDAGVIEHIIAGYKERKT